MKRTKVQIHAQVTIHNEIGPILVPGQKRYDELPQLCIEIPGNKLPISERKFLEIMAQLSAETLVRARAAGLTKP